MKRIQIIIAVFLVAFSVVAVTGCGTSNDTGGGAADTQSGRSIELLNVSYDPTRELYQEVNKIFIEEYTKQNGGRLEIQQSHGGSGKQARSVIDGLQADVVTLALAYDIDAIAQSGLIKEDWVKSFPNNSSPYTSTIVFLVRKGNPKGIRDWDDLVKPGVSVITPNPKTSGGARWNYLAAWGYSLNQTGGDQEKAKDFVRRLFQNVPILDTAARGALTTFVQRGLGDVFISWENEAILTIDEFGKDEYEIVVPSVSIIAEPPVAIVDSNVERRNTRDIAQAYLEFLYSDTGQRLAAKHHYRPRNAEAAGELMSQFSEIDLFTIDEVFGGWAKAQKEHFDDGGTFDQIYQQR